MKNLDELLEMTKLNNLIKKKEEEKSNMKYVIIGVGVVIAAACVGYALYKHCKKKGSCECEECYDDEYLSEFEDEFEDDFYEDYSDELNEEDDTETYTEGE